MAQYLGSRLGVDDAWAADLIAGGRVRLDGDIARPGDDINLSAGPHLIEIHFPDAWPRHMAATEMSLDVLYEDDDLLALDKPPGIVVHPARGHLDNNTLQNGVRFRHRSRLGDPDACVAPPHRLDKDTSGVILFALTRTAYVHLAGQFAARRVEKRYIALLDGVARFDTITCDSPIANDPNRKGLGKIASDDECGRDAKTDFRILETGADWTLAEAAPRTGRPHQIRIHAAGMGLPIAGDKEYNPFPGRLGMERQALHAASLVFDHPIGGNPLWIEAQLPDDMRLALERLRRDAPKPL